MKASAILVSFAAPLRFMPPELRQAIEQFLFQWGSGVDPQHHARWRRMWRRLYHSKAQQPVLQLYEVVERSGAFHARHMTIETRIFENQDGFYNLGGFRLWLKTGAAFGHYEACPAGGLTFVPNSCDYDSCSDDEMREFHVDAVAFLRTPYALDTLWPAVKPDQRMEMLETLMRDPKKEDQ